MRFARSILIPLILAAAAVAGWAARADAAGYTIWAQRRVAPAYGSKTFAGTQAGADAAKAWVGSNGVIQENPGSDAGINWGTLPDSVLVIRYAAGGMDLLGGRAALGVRGTASVARLGPFSTATSGGAIRIVDGVTFPQDSIGIRSALEEVRAAGGGTVYLPGGTYLVGAPIAVYSNTTLQGFGKATRLQTTTNSPPFISWELASPGGSQSGVVYVRKDAHDVRIDGISIKGGITPGDAITAQHGIFIGKGTTRVTVTNCSVDSVGWSGILARGSDHVIYGNRCRFNRVSGIEVWGDRITATGNHTEGNILSGFDIEGDEATPHYDRTVANNTSFHDTTGIYIGVGSNRTKITGNNIFGFSQRGIYCVASAGTPIQDLAIVGNLVRESKMTLGGYGIDVGNAISKWVVASNVVDSCGAVGTAGDGIVIEGTASDGIVTGNMVSNTYLGIALVASGHNIRVTGNTSIGPLPFYSTASGANVIVSDNTFATSSSGALSSSSSSYFPTFSVAQDSSRFNKGFYAGGQFVNKILRASATLDFPAITAPNTADLTVTVTGAAVGDEVFVGVPNGSVTAATVFTAWVSAANTVTVRAAALAGTPNPASGTFKVTVVQ